jgi:adenylate kinase family enzyme
MNMYKNISRLSIILMAVVLVGMSSCKTQQTITYGDAVDWTKARYGKLINKYIKDAGNKLDPDEMRLLFTPIGYDGGSNTVYYRDAERLLVDTVYSVMLQKAIAEGKTSIVIFTGPSASGKSTAAKTMDFSNTGLVYDAAFNTYKKLATAIRKAERAGMKDIKVIAVYNTVRNCFKNSVDRGKTSKRFIHIPYMIESYSNNINKMQQLKDNFPEVEFICFDKSDNVNAKRVSLDEACKWNFNVSQDDIQYLFNIMLDEINKKELTPHQLAYVAGDILSIKGLSDSNKALAQEIDRKIREMSK